ncbi:MAG: family phosphohydrolase [Clostridiaceae bacterium]|nr:family phosphohydrolase [Clostridiaceae bacterium]
MYMLMGVVKMEKNKRYISVSELKEGMALSREIFMDGKVLIGKGVPLSETIINKLKSKYAFSRVEIYYDDIEGSMESDNNIKPKTVEEIEQSFNELSYNVESIFQNIQNIQATGIKEVREFALSIQTELQHTSSVIKNIVLYGSGIDTIYRHSVNVAALSAILAKWIGLSNEQINLLSYSAILHDFGKTKIDNRILDKEGPLTKKEFEIIKSHPVIAYDFIKKIPFLDKSVSYGALMHHEKLDGSGYPLGISGSKIHQFAKIIAIADVFDAVNSDRVYKKSKGPFEALEIIQKESIGKLDYGYCEIFIKHVVNYYMGENVLLNNKKVCKIIQVDVNNLERPLLLDENSFLDLKQNKDLYIEKLVF